MFECIAPTKNLANARRGFRGVVQSAFPLENCPLRPPIQGIRVPWSEMMPICTTLRLRRRLC